MLSRYQLEDGLAAGPACRVSTPVIERITSTDLIRLYPLPDMKNPRHFEKLSTSVGLLALGAGFASLGALSFIKRHLEDAESGLLLNSAYPIVGALISILLGFTFFAIALRFVAARLKEEKAFGKVSRARDPQRFMRLCLVKLVRANIVHIGYLTVKPVIRSQRICSLEERPAQVGRSSGVPGLPGLPGLPRDPSEMTVGADYARDQWVSW
jgi:hypothetical protein